MRENLLPLLLPLKPRAIKQLSRIVGFVLEGKASEDTSAAQESKKCT
jgi:hypothetical protein